MGNDFTYSRIATFRKRAYLSDNQLKKSVNDDASKLPAIIAAALLLVAAFGHWPYAFYVLTRLIVCGCAIYLAMRVKSVGGIAWMWILGGVAVLFNPIVPVRMHRSGWQIVDLIGAVTLAVFVILSRPQSQVRPSVGQK